MALTIGILFVSCKKSNTDVNGPATVNVKTIIADSTSGDAYREYVGTVESENSVDLSFQINGNLEQIYVQEGQSVRQGQLIARINPSTYQNLYNATKAGLLQAKDNYDRLSILHQNNSLPEIKFIDAQTSLERAHAEERIAKKNLLDCNLYAPHAGVIGKRHVESGANVMPGSPIVSLMNITSVKIKVPVPENDIASIKLQTNCRIKIPALDDASFTGIISEKGVVADPASHTYDVKLKVINLNKQIMPGMVCKTYLPNNEKQSGIILPMKAVQVTSYGKSFVWLVNQAGKAVLREVTTGKLVGNGILIKSGLKQGDTVVVEGYQNLSQGVLTKKI